MVDAVKENESALLTQVREAKESGAVVDATLKTDERVFARITDGIYREPASALRELIANAYDADATEVRIDTDAPRFSRIVVRDDGHGLTEEALVHVICHIGGSLKRTNKGKEFNVVNNSNANLSPGGRKLIGKLGIGLFSVSQLTHHLTIVTKVRGDPFRRTCDILLMPQKELVDSTNDEQFVTGHARISTIPADDVDWQGTEITLLEIRPFVRESLQSQALWTAISEEPDIPEGEGVIEQTSAKSHSSILNLQSDDIDEDDEFVEKPIVPIYHIGRVSRADSEFLITTPSLPWTPEDDPKSRFLKLMHGVADLHTGRISQEKIKLNDVLDTYFRTIWTLSLSVPIPYIEKHPFSITNINSPSIYSLSNRAVRPKAEEIILKDNITIRDECKLSTPDLPSTTTFKVIFDGIELARPLEFPKPMYISDSVNPIIFVGKIKSEMTSLPDEYSGGPLEFEAYFYWYPRVIPTDHNGVMVRINGASGILFDEHFLKYQISEQNRLRQLTAEVFVIKGLDAALNIDRESFNQSHPHYQYLRKWIHHCLRQIMSRLKAVNKGAKDIRLDDGLSMAISNISEIVAKGRSDRHSESKVQISSGGLDFNTTEDQYTINKDIVFSPRANIKPTTKADKLKEELIQEQIKAIAIVLQDYGLLKTLDSVTKDELLRKIVAIFSVDIKS